MSKLNDNQMDHKPVYIVDWESDDDNPIVLECTVVRVLKDDGGYVDGDYLGKLLPDACSPYNMAFAKNEEGVKELLGANGQSL
jgi:hypothetical protein